MRVVLSLLCFVLTCVCAGVAPPSTLFTYTLTESTGGVILWTTTTIRKVLASDANPAATASGLHLAAARGEWESFQIVVSPGAPSSSDPVVDWVPFPTLSGTAQAWQAFRALYVPGLSGGVYPEELVPVAKGATVVRQAVNTIVWFNFFVPRDAPAGEHLTSISIGGINIPLRLYAFNFALPDAPKFSTQANKNIAGVADQNTLFDLRLSPTSVTWPSGPKYSITWFGTKIGPACTVFDDESTYEAPQFQCKALSQKFVRGQGWTENPRATNIGFGRWMTYQFVSNSQTRPANWCGFALDAAQLGGSPCTDLNCLDSPYNAAYGAYLRALQTWLTTNNLLNTAYIYVQNEPQNAADYKTAALLSRVHKKYAPNIKIAISEQPRPEIYADPQFGPGGYDIWIATPDEYHKPGNIALGNARIALGEEVWLYSLPQHLSPYWNPSRSDYSALDTRIMTWSCWNVRCRGWAYFDFAWSASGRNAGGFFSTSNVPTVKSHVLRDAIDDYDYLFLANANNFPALGTNNAVDQIVNSAASTLASWNRHDPDAQQKLRNDLGRFIEGSLACAPVLSTPVCPAGTQPRKSYFINFQAATDPYPAGSIEPQFEGPDGVKVFWDSIKIGAAAWQPMKRFGTGPGQDPIRGFVYQIETLDLGRFLSAYRGCTATTGSQSQCTYIYDDFGRTNLFNWGIENGAYDVTVTFGQPGRAVNTDVNSIYVEGVQFWDAPLPSTAAQTVTKTVTVQDCMLTLQFGVFNMYTFLSSLSIVPAGGNATLPCGSPVLPFNTTTLTTPAGSAFGATTSLSSGAIAGIVIGALIGVALAVVLALVLVRHQKASGVAQTPYHAMK